MQTLKITTTPINKSKVWPKLQSIEMPIFETSIIIAAIKNTI